MKFFKWKIFMVTSLVCLLPILLGLSLWASLPDEIAIHFDFYGRPDNFVSKGIAVFGLPVLMVALQGFCCFIYDLNVRKYGEIKKVEVVNKWIIPCLSVVLQVVTFGYSLGWQVDIRKTIALILGILFLVMGNYMPKFDYVKHYKLEKEKARKINRFMGYETVVMGLLFMVSLFLPPWSTAFCCILLIPYVVVSAVYGIVAGKKEKQ